MMMWYHWLALFSFLICMGSCLIHALRLIRNGSPTDYSKPLGNIEDATLYSMTAAMSPTKKESAYLHLPTYTAGLLFHLGTFVSLFLFILFFFSIYPQGILATIIAVTLIITGLSGLGILIKRISKPQLRALSNPDDYISNLLVSLVQLMTAWMIFNPGIANLYFVLVAILFLYLPLGKLKHTIYFFAARYHLGFFYGWRGVWPPKKG